MLRNMNLLSFIWAKFFERKKKLVAINYYQIILLKISVLIFGQAKSVQEKQIE